MDHHSVRHPVWMLALLACASVSSADAQTDEQLIRAVDSAWNVAFANRDTVSLVKFYTTDAVGMYPNTTVMRGSPAIGHMYATFVTMPAVKLIGTPTSVVIAKSGELATVNGAYHLTGNSDTGPVVDSGSYVEVLQKVNGQWRIANEIVTSAAPMRAMAAFDTAA